MKKGRVKLIIEDEEQLKVFLKKSKLTSRTSWIQVINATELWLSSKSAKISLAVL
jgi:hypothetical protein